MGGEVGFSEGIPSPSQIDKRLMEWCLARINSTIVHQNLPGLQPVSHFKREPYVYNHRFLGIIASFRLGNSGLFKKFPSPPPKCPVCDEWEPLCDRHILLECAGLSNVRLSSNLLAFKENCQAKGHNLETTFKFFIGGLDSLGHSIPLSDYILRGQTLVDMSKEWLNLTRLML